MKIIGMFLTVCGLVAGQSAQAPNPVQPLTENAASTAAGAIHVSRVIAIARTTKAIDPHRRSGYMKIAFRGTSLLP